MRLTQEREKNVNTAYFGLRPDLLRHISGKSIKVLDVGCATGANGEYLRNQGIASEVYGIEISRDMAAVAGRTYAEVFLGDLDSMNLECTLSDKEFDVIVIGDVLEHLIDPWTVLKRLARHLKESGKMIVSLPNVQHIDVFLHVFVKGCWPHNDRGIFDKTHLRFFTYKTMVELLNAAGLSILHVERNYRRRDAINSRFGRVSIERLLKQVFKNLYTFQFIFVCNKYKKNPEQK